MRKITLSRLVFLLLIAMPALAFAADRVTFDKQWMDYDVTEDGVKGMRIHLKFTATGLKDSLATIAIYFEFDDARGRLKDRNQKFNSAAGDVAVYRDIKPQYDPAIYNDLSLFMPYTEFDLFPGSYFLKMDVDLIRPQGGLIQHLNFHKFDYTEPQTSAAGSPVNTTPSAKVTNIWVDYDVTDNGQKGMMIHSTFTLYNLKGVDAYLAIAFEMKNGEKILTNNMTYRSKSGQLTLYRDLKPGYNEAVFTDMKSFLPYTELNLGKGSFELRFGASVIYKDGNLVGKLGDKDFKFSQ